MIGWEAALCGPAALSLGLTALNLLTWPRGAPTVNDARGNLLRSSPSDRLAPLVDLPAAAPRVSVLIPARNEAANIERCVRSVMGCGDALHEVVVFDDLSTDATPAILEELVREFGARGLRVVKGSGLPSGWVGKPHACHRLSQEATGDVLLFLDADVQLEAGGVGRVLSLMEGKRADVVTMMPRQVFDEGESVIPGLIVPLLHLTYTSWFPLVLTWMSRDVRFLAANGQVLAVSRAAYDAVGGFAAVRDQVVDDMAFCTMIKRSGRRVVFADGFSTARCQMYRTGEQVWEGFSKNIYPGLGANPAALFFVIALYLWAFVLPYGVLGAALVGVLGGEWLVAGAAGVGMNVATRAMLAARMGHPWWGVLAQPVAVLGLLAIAVNSARWVMTGRVRWSGRMIAVKGSPEAGDALAEIEAR